MQFTDYLYKFYVYVQQREEKGLVEFLKGRDLLHKNLGGVATIEGLRMMGEKVPEEIEFSDYDLRYEILIDDKIEADRLIEGLKGLETMLIVKREMEKD